LFLKDGFMLSDFAVAFNDIRALEAGTLFDFARSYSRADSAAAIPSAATARRIPPLDRPRRSSFALNREGE
jgi:hypothetical protein